MDNSHLLIETFYSRQLLNEEVKFYDQYQSIHGNRAKEFFGYYRDGLAIQKELVMEIQSIEITEKILQEKFGDNFAAKISGAGLAALDVNANIWGAGGFGTLGKFLKTKLRAEDPKSVYKTQYIDSRNQNFTRSFGDYFAQLKTFDKNVPDVIGGIPVKRSGVLKGLFQKGGQIAVGGAMGALAAAGFPGSAAIGTAVAAIGGAEKFIALLNKKFDDAWKKLQNTKPVQDFDRMFEVQKQELINKLSKTDKDGKETSKILQTVDQLAKYVKQNPGKSGVVIALMTAAIGIGAGPLGLGILTVTKLPILTAAVAFFLRTGLGLLKGEKASTAVGGALKAAAVGWLTGEFIRSVVGPIFDAMIKVPQPAVIQSDIINKVTDATGQGWEHQELNMYTNYRQIMVGGITNKGTVFQGFNGSSFAIGEHVKLHIVTTPGNAAEIQSMSDNINELSKQAFDVFKTGDQAGAQAVLNKVSEQLAEVRRAVYIIANDPENTKLVNAFKKFEEVMAANADVKAATQEFNKVYFDATQGVATGVAAAAGAGIGSVPGTNTAVPPGAGKPPVKESLMLSSIVDKLISEANSAPVNPVKLTGNQQDAVNNLKQNIEKEMREYIQDVAKTFNVSGNNTTEVLNSLKNIEGAKSAYELIEKVKADFKNLPRSLNLNFPEDIVVSKSVKDSEKTTGVTSTQTSATGEPLTREEENIFRSFQNEFGKLVLYNPKKYDFVKYDSTGKVIKDDNYYNSVFCAFLDEFEKKYPKIYEKYKNTKAGESVKDCKNTGATSGATSGATPGATPGAGDSGGSYANKNLAKYVTGLKGSPLFSGNLQQRVVDMLKTVDDPKSPEAKASIATLKTFLIKFSKAISDASAQYRQKVGDPNDVRTKITQNPQFTSLAEAAKDLLAQNKARQAFINDFTAVIPNLVGATFELSQVFNKKNPNSVYNFSAAPAQPPKLPMNEDLETKGKPVVPNTGATGNLTGPDIANARAMFAKLIDLGLILQGLNPNGFTKANLKQLIITCLDIGDVLVYKKGSKKTNKIVDNALQGLDLLGPSQAFKPKEKTLVMAGLEDKPLTPKFLYQYFGDKWNTVTKAGLKPLDVKDADELIQKLNTLSKAGRNDYDKAIELIKTNKKDKSKGISYDVGNQIKEGSPYNLSDYRKFFI